MPNRGSIQFVGGTSYISDGTNWFPLSPVIKTGSFATAADATDKVFFTADRPYLIVNIAASHDNPANAETTLDIKKVVGDQAIADAASVIIENFDLACKSGCKLESGIGLTNVENDLYLAIGDKLAFKFTGNATGLTGGTVSAMLIPM